jgi:hypothetical protein
MNKRTKLYKFGISALSLMMLSSASVVPLIHVEATTTPDASGYGDIIPCDGVENECGFDDLVALAVNVINKLIIFSTFIAIGVFSFAGIKLLTSGGNAGAMKQAKDMALKVLIGYVVILLAWVVVYTIMDVLVKPDAAVNIISN